MESKEKQNPSPKYRREDYWKLVDQGIVLHPSDFGCKDWDHDETGQVNCWVPPRPGSDYSQMPDNGIPFEKQHYQLEPDETRRDNLQAGWSKRIDQGMISDYWRQYSDWN